MSGLEVKILTKDSLEQIIPLVSQLNPNLSESVLAQRQTQMFTYENYRCFGLFQGHSLIGVSSDWLTTRLYSGKQVEIDNVIVDSKIQSKGYGKFMLEEIEKWAVTQNCRTIELNTYVGNERSHKFYFNHGYKILGFHFQKEL